MWFKDKSCFMLQWIEFAYKIRTRLILFSTGNILVLLSSSREIISKKQAEIYYIPR